MNPTDERDLTNWPNVLSPTDAPAQADTFYADADTVLTDLETWVEVALEAGFALHLELSALRCDALEVWADETWSHLEEMRTLAAVRSVRRFTARTAEIRDWCDEEPDADVELPRGRHAAPSRPTRIWAGLAARLTRTRGDVPGPIVVLVLAVAMVVAVVGGA